jgi:hypothetical protein
MMTEDRGLNRRGFLKMTTGAMLGMAGAEPVASSAAPAAQEGREVIQGIRTRRAIPGEPYDLAGKRLVFTNWHYVRPGDLDWVNDQGKSVYVHGNEGPWGAHYRGIDTPRGIRLAAQRPQRIGPLSRPSRILQEGPIIRGWAGGGYFESVDGLQWERKADLINAPDFSNVFVDPSAPEAERYKCVWVDDAIGAAEFEAYRKRRPDDWEPRALLHLAETGRVAGIRGAVSPDGIRWTKLPEPLVIEYSDTEIVAYYDAWRGKYVLYTRYWSVGPYTRRLPADIRHSWTGVGRRAIGRSETDDFRRFPPSRMIVEPTPDMAPSDVLYTNCRTSIPGAPDHHLMFPTIWHVDEDTTSVTMLSSHDGEVWHFVPGAPLMQQGASALMQRGAPALMQRGAPALMETQPFGQWDGGCVWVSPPLLELPDGRFALPYRGDNFPHKYPRGQRKSEEGYAIWPRGRLVALEAPDRGEFATVAIMPPGRKLRINALTQRVGSILVQVDGAPGRSFAEATPIVGDQYRTPVTWKGQEDLGHKEGSPIILRFRMEKAKLFGLEFE